ncbi:MAG: hypothetical protein LBU84_00595 [Prevotella sp.]|jgi:hypothetical protein|nr:hypothetical protein [Prevotella sp.]
MKLGYDIAMKIWERDYGNAEHAEDYAGRYMLKSEYRNTISLGSWDIYRIIPVSKGGGNEMANLHAVNIKTTLKYFPNSLLMKQATKTGKISFAHLINKSVFLAVYYCTIKSDNFSLLRSIVFILTFTFCTLLLTLIICKAINRNKYISFVRFYAKNHELAFRCFNVVFWFGIYFILELLIVPLPPIVDELYLLLWSCFLCIIEDYEYELAESYEDACPYCKGRGYIGRGDFIKSKCSTCHGVGYDSLENFPYTCPECHGEGTSYQETINVCDHCKGTGKK